MKRIKCLKLISSINGTKVECKGSEDDVLMLLIIVLMEPKWNVKRHQSAVEAGIVRINGTKVECKDRTGIAPLLIQLVLMEPKWNIKQGYFLVRVTGKLIES